MSRCVQKSACFAVCSQPECLSMLLRVLKGSGENGKTSEGRIVPLLYDDENGSLLPGTDPINSNANKDVNAYFGALCTKQIGRNLLYSPTIPSTMKTVSALQDKLSKNLQCGNGFVCWAEQQTAGRGRKGNEWTSPVGCAMFSVSLPILLSSRLGKHLSFIQHLASIACVTAAENGQNRTGLRLKWPNDIYFVDGDIASASTRRVKIGGIYVTSTITHIPSPTAWCNIGIGVNVTNEQPTMCVNQVLSETCGDAGDFRFTVPTFIAAVLNQLELLLEQCDAFGVESLLPLYYRYWLHSGQKITVNRVNQLPNNTESAGQARSNQIIDSCPGAIEGIDEFGMLKIKFRVVSDSNSKDDKVFEESVQPDLATFDIFQGVITVRSEKLNT